MEQSLEPSIEGAIDSDTEVSTGTQESSVQGQVDATNAVETVGGSNPNVGSASVNAGGFDTIVVDTAPISAGPALDVVIGFGILVGVIVQTVTAPNAVPAGMMPNPTSLANKIAQAITAGLTLAVAIDLCLQAAADGKFDSLSFGGGTGSAGDRER